MDTYGPPKTATEVQQASPRRMNLRVLTASLIGVVIPFAILTFGSGVLRPASA